MNILWFSNPSYGAYGYSRVTKNVVEGLRKAGHETIILGNITQGNIIPDERGNKNLPTYFDGWGSDTLEHYLKSYDIDLMVLVLDTWMDPIQYLPKLTKKLNIPLITHATIRANPLSPFIARFLIESDHVVAPSKYGYKTTVELKELMNKTSYIPHGVDLGTFKRIPDMREKMKKRLGYDDKFVYLSVGRNNFYMKKYDIMYRAYKTMVDNEPDTKRNTVLHLHCMPNEPNSIKLDVLRNRIGMNDQIKFSYARPKNNWEGIELCAENDPHAMPHNPNFGMDELEMAKMYNMSDTHVMTTEGESFALPVLESQACGIPQVFPNHTTGPELIGEPKAGLLASIQAEVTAPLINDVFYADPTMVAKCMHHMYSNPGDREVFSRNALENAKQYSWHKIIPMWLELIEGIGKKKNTVVDYMKGDMGV